jgi:hypothetical protein
MVTYSLLRQVKAGVGRGLDDEQIIAAYTNKFSSQRDVSLALYALRNPPAPISFKPDAFILKNAPGIYESVAYPGKKIKVLTTLAWSFALDRIGILGIPREPTDLKAQSFLKDFLLKLGYQEADIDEALDIFIRDRQNREVSNEATEINRYFNDKFYGISSDNKFIQYVFLAIGCMVVFLIFLIFLAR